MIELKNVCYAYGKEIALRYINLNIQKGESVIIQGPNGCGKSTLIKLLNGIIFPMEGSYTYQGHEITEKTLKDTRFAKWFHQQMGYVFQNADTQLFCGSVEEEIAFGPTQMGLSENEIKQRTEDCLKLFGIEKLRERPPYHLSGGEKRKVSLACILSMNPEVLILDEPLAGLDENTQKMLIDFLKKFHVLGKTLIIITHNNQLAKELGTRFIKMNDKHEITI
nr:ABC transporter ATP-binding protein [uncultured Anaerobutyricum sp.]